MKTRKRFKYILYITLCISLTCAVYLNSQIQIHPEEMAAVSFTDYEAGSNLIFPEVEVLKVVIEKFFDVITLARV